VSRKKTKPRSVFSEQGSFLLRRPAGLFRCKCKARQDARVFGPGDRGPYSRMGGL